MRIVILAVLIIFIIALAGQIYVSGKKIGDAKAGYNEAQKNLNEAKKENESLTADIEYFLNPLNLEKELKSRFNYKAAGEKMIIIVPGNQTTSTQ